MGGGDGGLKEGGYEPRDGGGIGRGFVVDAATFGAAVMVVLACLMGQIHCKKCKAFASQITVSQQ